MTERTELRPSVVSSNGSPWVRVLSWKGSHDVVALAPANALARLEPGPTLGAGATVPCYTQAVKLLPPNMQLKLNDLLEASRRWSEPDLRRALEALGRADRRMKRGSDPATTLVAAVVESCGGGVRPTSPRPGR